MRRLVLLVAAATLAAMLPAAAFAGVRASADLRRVYERDGVLTLLVLGSDIGPPDRAGDMLRGRADAIHLIAVDVRRREATVVDIPRDSWIGGDKINAHLTYGGPEAMVRVLEGYTGIAIDYWAITSFDGLRHLTDTLGGVPVEVDVPMYDAGLRVSFDPGRTVMEGNDAIKYLRSRKSLPDGDFGRTRHQGNFLRAAHQHLRREHRDLPSLLRLAAAFARNTVTNVPTGQLIPLAQLALEIEPRHVRQVPLTGAFGTSSGGASIVYLQPGDAFERIKRGDIGP